MSHAHLTCVTSSYPFGDGESFLGPELEALQAMTEVEVVPLWPRGALRSSWQPTARLTLVARHPLGVRVLAGAAAELVAHPLRCLAAIRPLHLEPGPKRLRNLVAVPKGLWLARRIRRRATAHIHAYWATLPATVAMVAGAVAGIGWSMTAHRGDVLAPNLLRVKLASARSTRCVSVATSVMIAEHLGRRLSPSDRWTVIHLGVALPPRISERAEPGAPVRVLCPAALSPRKRQSDLLRAISRCREAGFDVCLSLAGSGPDEAALRSEVEDLHLSEFVTFLGQVSHDDLLHLYLEGTVDIVALASDSEGIPVSLMEAMAYGVPVVATDAGGVRELVGGGAGALVGIGDVDGLASALQEVAASRSVRRHYVSAGRQRVENEFDATRCAEALMAMIDGEDARGDGTES